MPAGEPTPPPCLIDPLFARGDSYEMPQSPHVRTRHGPASV